MMMLPSAEHPEPKSEVFDQLIGPPRGDAKVLAAAYALEQVLGLPSTPIDPIVRH